MKKLKYRVWNYNTNRMLYTDWTRFPYWYDEPIHGKIQYRMGFQGEARILSRPMEFVTCLNNVEAYNGDIVKWSGDYKIGIQTGKKVSCKHFEIGVIYYNKERLQYSVLVYKQLECNYSGEIAYSQTLRFYDWRVIGNIYASPYLFKMEDVK